MSGSLTSRKKNNKSIQIGIKPFKWTGEVNKQQPITKPRLYLISFEEAQFETQPVFPTFKPLIYFYRNNSDPVVKLCWSLYESCSCSCEFSRVVESAPK